jgi:hypothetical protein
MSRLEPTSGPPTVRRDQEEPPRLGITFNQLVGSAVAAAAAAFGASYLGVAGTIIGAAVASVIATVASALYSRSLQRTREVVQSTVTQWSRTAAVAPVVDPGAPEPRERRPFPWARVSLALASVMALAFGALTTVEAVLGEPISSLVGGSDTNGTTLGSVGGSDGSDTTPRRKHPPTPEPTVTPSGTPTTVPSATPSAEPTETPTAAPTGVPTPSPTPSGEPTGTPPPPLP